MVDAHASAVADPLRSREMLETIVESAPLAILVSDRSGVLRLVNREAERLFGYSRDELVGLTVDRLVPTALRGRHPALRESFLRAPETRAMGRGRDLFGVRKDGSEVAIEIGLTPIDTADGMFVLTTMVDVTERKRLDRLSREDPLTGLANRRDFDPRLEAEILRAQRQGTPLVVALFDLDRFKRVNDAYGHALGDEVLRMVAHLLREQCRAIDLVARYGGEEFVLALPGTDLRAGGHLCERIRMAIERFAWDRLQPGLALTISAGIAAWGPGEDAPSLLARADAHLYAAKRQGRNRVVGLPP